MRRLSNRHIEILDYLRSNTMKTSHDIMQHTHRSYNGIARDLRTLTDLKCLKRHAASEGHQFFYEYKTHSPTWPVSKKSKPVDPVKFEPFTSEQVALAYNNWPENGWQPKILHFIWNLSDVIGRLGELAALSMIHGDEISQYLIDEQREKLEDLDKIAVAVHNEVQKMLATRDLWDSNKLCEFLLENFEAEDLLTKSKTIQALRALQGVLDQSQ